MIDAEGFKKWLTENTSFSVKVIYDIISRLRRVDSLLPWRDEEVYSFWLEQNCEYQKLSVSVKSQCRRAVKLYANYIHSSEM